jgi:pimeloyl-ACP methyl ester carboxylesterase
MGVNGSVMFREPLPVMLVHGWNSHPGIWNRLVLHLSGASIPYWKFDHGGMTGSDIAELAIALDNSITDMRNDSGYTGPIDIVSHSVGTCITRYLLEVVDGTAQDQKVRRLIGLGPPNNGSALAELFHDPLKGGEVINRLTGVFLKPGFDPSADAIVQDVRPGSPVMLALRSAGIRPDITYRIIVTGNPGGRSDFFPQFGGKTWEIATDGGWQQTYEGDGIVPHRESRLPGISLDIVSLDPDDAALSLPPGQYGHINLPKNPVVIERIMRYLTQTTS